MDWNARYLAHDTPWDKQAAHPEWIDFFSDKKDLGTVLLPGCGFGHDAGFLAQTGAFSQVNATDISPIAIKQAKETYPSVDFFLSDFLHDSSRNSYDWICEHTLFCAIDLEARPSYVQAIAKSLRNGGSFIGIFYLETGNPDGVGPPFRSSEKELDDHFANDFILQKSWVPQNTFAGREQKEQVRLYQKK